jgi:hypothetical protein
MGRVRPAGAYDRGSRATGTDADHAWETVRTDVKHVRIRITRMDDNYVGTTTT